MILQNSNWYRAKIGGVWYLDGDTMTWGQTVLPGCIISRDYDTYKNKPWPERKAVKRRKRR